MSATDLIRWTTRGVLLLLALLTLVDLLRHRDRRRLDIHLVFAALAGTILIGVVQRWSGTTARWPALLGGALFLAKPYLLLRVVEHFRAVPMAVRAAGLASVLVSWGALALTPLPPPRAVLLVIVLGFVWVEAYGALALAAAARRTAGPTRWRLSLAASGSAFLVAALLLAGALALRRPGAGGATPVGQLLTLGLAFTYYLAFAPPRWLRQGWHFAHLHGFLRDAAGLSGTERAQRMLDLLGPTAVRAIGGVAAAVAMQDASGEGLVIRESAAHRLAGKLPATDGALGRAWRDGEPAFARAPKGEGEEEGRLAARLGATAFYALPIATPGHRYGVLLVFSQQGALFPGDDLALLELLAGQAAVAVEEAELLEQRQALVLRMQESEQRYRLLFESSPQPTWVFDVETLAFLAVNEAALGHYGYSLDEFQQMTILDIRPAEDVPALLENVRTAGAVSVGEPWRHKKRDGTLIDVEIHSHRVSLAGRPAGLVIVNDVTQRRQAEREIRKLSEDLADRAEELQAINRELEAFSYSVSHDLRAPLRQMDGFSRILLEQHGGRLDADGRRYLELIRQGATHMGQLIDDLLNLARVSRKEVVLSDTDLGELLQRVVAELRPEAEGRQVDWRVGRLPRLACDAALMKQVFVNLLQNALKFTRPRACAVIEVGEERRDETAALFVRDNGVGFNMKYAEKLFGVFQRLHRQEEFEGTGVGLATVQRIVHRHGGRIWAEAELGRGATFYFTCQTASPSPDVGGHGVAGTRAGHG